MAAPIELRGARVSVIGAARSGLAVSALLRRAGAAVFVSDSGPPEKHRAAAEALAGMGVRCEFGGHSAQVCEADLLVLSPGVPSDAAVVRGARERGIRVVSEVEVASWFWPGRIVAVTGTNGKTTTTTLAGRIVGDARVPHVVAGNIGVAFSEVVRDGGPDAVAVLEISSFQLDHIETFRPSVAVLLNITPDHLDRYGHSFARYIAAKSRVFECQLPGDVLVYNADDGVARTVVQERAPAGVVLLPFTTGTLRGDGACVRDGFLTVVLGGVATKIVARAEMSLPGSHNVANALAAALAGCVLGVAAASVRATLRNFRGVEHRLEFVRELEGVAYVNDSKATNVDAVWYALQSFAAPIVVLLGGRDKGNDYRRLEELVRRHVRAVVAIGESADRVETAFAGVVPVTRATSMAEAVGTARGLAQRGDVVLLSPACASFDWFDNYEHRGRVFKQIVLDLPARA